MEVMQVAKFRKCGFFFFKFFFYFYLRDKLIYISQKDKIVRRSTISVRISQIAKIRRL